MPPPLDAEAACTHGAQPRTLPSLPLPPPILSTTPGTWSYDTMSRRVNEEILERTWDENADSFLNDDKFADAVKNFQALREELRDAANVRLRHLLPLKGSSAEDKDLAQEMGEWREILDPYVLEGDTWLSAPWLVTEFYVYRRLMEALGFFDGMSSTYQFDPFDKQKRAGLIASVGSAEPIMGRIENLARTPPDNWESGIEVVVELALWGNKMDLSLWPADVMNGNGSGEEVDDVFAKVLKSATENLLHDDTEKLLSTCKILREKGGGSIDIIVDNAGFELVTDLALADHLVTAGVANTVTFQLKSHPTFVSDAMEKDLRDTVDYYASIDESKYPNCKRAGKRWRSYLDEGKWVCREDRFWVQGLAMWDMPERLWTDMWNRCDLAFVKGDANYRRLLGDREWEYTAAFQDVVGSYFPSPVCALRTLKAELGCGMDAEQVARAKDLDKNWLVNGRFGVIHYGTGAAETSSQKQA